LLRLDKGSGRVIRRVKLPDTPLALAVAHGQVWVGSGGPGLLRVDPATGRITSVAVAGGEVTGLVADAGAHRVYGLVTGGARGRVLAWSDMDGHLVASHLEAGTGNTNTLFPTSGAIAFGNLWVTTSNQGGTEGSVERLGLNNLRAHEPGRIASAGSAPDAISAGRNALWLTRSDANGMPTLTCFRPVTPSYLNPSVFVLPINGQITPSAGGPAASLAVVGSTVYIGTAGLRVQQVDAATACPRITLGSP
jgi:hypothetical protein